MSNRSQNGKKYPSQYEGRRGRRDRLMKLGFRGATGTLQESPLNRYGMGKSPSESVSSYRERLDALSGKAQESTEQTPGILGKIRGFLSRKFGAMKEAA